MTNAKIELDMFDVGLGSSILTRLYLNDGQQVTVLSDGGRAGCNLVSKLKKKEIKRLDLIIGTHYDADHLSGLISIVQCNNWDIGEVWLPPYYDSLQKRLNPEQSMLDWLNSEENKAQHKRYNCIRLEIAHCLNWALSEKTGETVSALNQSRSDNDNLAFFESCLEQANKILENNNVDIVDQNTTENRYADLSNLYRGLRSSRLSSINPVKLALYQRANCLLEIRKNHLTKLVNALKAKRIPYRTHIIEIDDPKTFIWNGTKFTLKSSGASVSQPSITLLAPSICTVNKYKNILPVLALSESNQLSYISVIKYLSQKILLTGDSGFDHFVDKGSYRQKLISELKNIHVVEVAHHGGDNGRFYDVLNQAGFSNGSQEKFLLLSHKLQDPVRPNTNFKNFVLAFNQIARNTTKILFTNKPLPQNVVCYSQLISPSVNSNANRDDVCLEFLNNKWNITKHAKVL